MDDTEQAGADPNRLILDAAGRLAAGGVDSPRHDAESLLALALGVTRGQLASVSHVDEPTRTRFEHLVARRSKREPLQHLSGTAAFRYCDVEVGPGVFVPRPETELVAGAAIDELRGRIADGVEHPRAVDLCTGSGAIALAMASEVPAAQVIAVELLEPAHAYARRNLGSTSVDLRLGDIRTAVAELDASEHVVVANPPYVPLSEYESVSVEARQFDPPEALWSGTDGLDVIATVEQIAARALVDAGLVVCEHADLQGDAVVALFRSTGRWDEVRDNRDLADRPRFVTARRRSRDRRVD
jgi:release factor glutamine methyltransferase